MKRAVLIAAAVAIGAGALWLARYPGGFPAFVGEQGTPPKTEWTIATESIPLLTPHIHEYESRKQGEAAAGEMSQAAVFLHGVEVLSDTVTTSQDLWITSYRIAINNAPDFTLHHAGLIRLDQPNPVCPRYHDELLGMAPPVTEAAVFPGSYGVFLPKGTPLQLYAMFHNPLPPLGPGTSYENVSATVMMETVLGAASARTPLEFVRLHIDDEPCAGAIGTFTVPEGVPHYERSGVDAAAGNPARYVFSRDSTIMLWGAHLHPWEGGEKVTALLNGNPIAEFVPRHIGFDSWTWALPMQYPDDLEMKAGDTLAISATYSNPTDQSLIGAMGMLGFWFTAP